MTGVPLVTMIFPGVMNPVPLAKTAVRVVDAPGRIDEAPAVKLVITGVAGVAAITALLRAAMLLDLIVPAAAAKLPFRPLP